MDNREICRTYMQAFDRGDLDTLRAVHAPDFVWHHLAPTPGSDVGLEFLLQGAAGIKGMMTDFEHKIEALHGMGDYVVMVTNGGGRPVGQPPEAEIRRSRAITLHRVENGLIQETWSLPDLLGFLLNKNLLELSPEARALLPA